MRAHCKTYSLKRDTVPKMKKALMRNFGYLSGLSDSEDEEEEEEEEEVPDFTAKGIQAMNWKKLRAHCVAFGIKRDTVPKMKKALMKKFGLNGSNLSDSEDDEEDVDDYEDEDNVPKAAPKSKAAPKTVPKPQAALPPTGGDSSSDDGEPEAQPSLLCEAAKAGNADEIERLLDAGAKADETDGAGRPALMLASV